MKQTAIKLFCMYRNCCPFTFYFLALRRFAYFENYFNTEVIHQLLADLSGLMVGFGGSFLDLVVMAEGS